MNNIKKAKLSDLIPDNKNFNKHTEYGMHLLEQSISQFGLGRSIVIDKNNHIIGGNGVVETASNLQMEDCIVVPTDGKTLVVVKREDVDIDSKVGRGLCIADNATGKANLAWDMDIITEQAERFAIDPEDWGVKIDGYDIDPNELSDDFNLKSGDKDPIQQMTFTLADSQVEMIKSCIEKVLSLYPEECAEFDGNTNRNGNALAKIIRLWEKQKK